MIVFIINNLLRNSLFLRLFCFAVFGEKGLGVTPVFGLHANLFSPVAFGRLAQAVQKPTRQASTRAEAPAAPNGLVQFFPSSLPLAYLCASAGSALIRPVALEKSCGREGEWGVGVFTGSCPSLATISRGRHSLTVSM